MRMPRRRFLLAFALAIALGLFFHFGVYYHAKGWLRGDTYFKGMPTCYWADCLNGDHGTPKWLKSVYDFLGARPFSGFEGREVFSADPDSAGVLLQLAADPSNGPDVREKAISRLHTDHKERASDLARICAEIFTNEKEEMQMRLSVAYTLMALIASRKAADFDVGRQLQSADPNISICAAGIMWAQGKNRQVIGPLLVSKIEEYPTGGAAQEQAHRAMMALQGFSDTDAIPFLLDASSNPERWVRLASTWGIRTWLEKRCNLTPDREPLKSALSRLGALAASDSDREVREWAARALDLAKRGK